ncbi:MAG: 7-carboxy-7-deazaguanine synthase QueE [Muribaculaceae bacterium]|nr:7-carboxy-7-deazaguanine synthase QueE [Muribaculaceae bacterium]
MTQPAKTYAVNEIFYSLQGEGFHTGTPAVFLRLSGCNRRCAFCDTDFSAATPMTAAAIAEACAAFPARHIVVTGGEPLLQLDDALVSALKACGFFIQVETNGSMPAPAGVDWVTCSPKEPPYAIDRINELKIVYQGQDVEATASLFAAQLEKGSSRSGVPPRLYLQPCSGLNTAETVAYILGHPCWRLSLQTHKLINIQ